METRRSDVGFTLWEALVVLAIIGVMSLTALPNVLNWQSEAKLRVASDNLRGDLELAKVRAIQENSYVAIQLSRKAYKVFVDNGAHPGMIDPGESLLKYRQLPAGVTIDLEATTFDGDAIVGRKTRFSGRGTARNGTAVLVNSQGIRRKVVISQLGRIRVERIR
ncbi:MAG: GspH/FimT family pseudopilin [Desulfobacterales bacterium]|nr:MAG: GspH/FimT family pseudopilin [Desulfobacterales bacterium]